MRHALLFVPADGGQHPLIILRNDLFKAGKIVCEAGENFPAECRSSLAHIVLQDLPQLRNIIVLCQFLQDGHILVHAAVKAVVQVEDIGDAPAHACGEVFARCAENDRTAAGHVFEAMVPAALRHQGGAGIADAEALSRYAVEIGFAGRGPEEGDVAHDDITVRLKGAVLVRNDNELAAGKALAEAVVGVAGQADGDALRQKGPEGLAASAAGVDDKGVVRQGIAEVFGHLGAEDGPEGAVRGGDLQGGLVVSDHPAARLVAGKSAQGCLFFLQISCEGLAAA